jgi:hypothetical protein
MRLSSWISAAAAVASVALSCTDNTPTCVPDAAASDCFCANGARGQRTCNASGLDYGQCVCSGDAGIDSGENTGGAPGNDDAGGASASDAPLGAGG